MAAAGKFGQTVGHELKSKTSGVTSVRMAPPDNSVVLVDTPAFDDTKKSDSDILKLIAAWLKKTCVFNFSHDTCMPILEMLFTPGTRKISNWLELSTFIESQITE